MEKILQLRALFIYPRVTRDKKAASLGFSQEQQRAPLVYRELKHFFVLYTGARSTIRTLSSYGQLRA